jgi:hypothetical protein
LTVRGQQLAVEIEAGRVTYDLEEGDGLTIYHVDERLDLRIRLSHEKRQTLEAMVKRYDKGELDPKVH